MAGLSLGLCGWALPTVVFGCGVIRGPAATAEDYIDAEQAVIIWDEAHKTEHFIRQVDIRAQEPDLGFLVPTPQVPELVEADPRIFQLAAEIGHPNKVREVVYHQPLQVFFPVLKGPLNILAFPFITLLTGMSGGPDEPKIISEQNVAGYHAVTLAATNAAGLARWLQENNYAWTPQLGAWLKPYVNAEWTITAFKFIKTGSANPAPFRAGDPIVSRAIRMSFTTDRPFFPYSEPGDNDRARAASPYGRTLRVAVLSSERMMGMLGDHRRWPGDLQFAGSPEPVPNDRLGAQKWTDYAKLPKPFALPGTLTYWRDDSNPRPGTSDLYFSPARDQTSFRKREIDYSVPALHLFDLSDPFSDLAGVVIVLLLPAAPLFCGWRLIRFNRASSSPGSGVGNPQPLFALDRILGMVSVVMGTLYFSGCLAMAYLFSRAEDWLPGMPLPPICHPRPCIFVGLLFLPLVYCGIAAFRKQPATGERFQHRNFVGRYWEYLMAGWSLLLGVGFCLTVVVAFMSKFSD